jgi:hypothetical protein
MTTILRIEHKDGCGIFRSYASGCLVNAKTFHERHNNFPSPKDDMFILRNVEDDEFCAFKSIEQLQEWVTADEIKQFIKLNCKVLLIDVSECIVGEYQILYKKENIIQTKDISELFI